MPRTTFAVEVCKNNLTPSGKTISLFLTSILILSFFIKTISDISALLKVVFPEPSWQGAVQAVELERRMRLETRGRLPGL